MRRLGIFFLVAGLGGLIVEGPCARSAELEASCDISIQTSDPRKAEELRRMVERCKRRKAAALKQKSEEEPASTTAPETRKRSQSEEYDEVLTSLACSKLKLDREACARRHIEAIAAAAPNINAARKKAREVLGQKDEEVYEPRMGHTRPTTVKGLRFSEREIDALLAKSFPVESILAEKFPGVYGKQGTAVYFCDNTTTKDSKDCARAVRKAIQAGKKKVDESSGMLADSCRAVNIGPISQWTCVVKFETPEQVNPELLRDGDSAIATRSGPGAGPGGSSSNRSSAAAQ